VVLLTLPLLWSIRKLLFVFNCCWHTLILIALCQLQFLRLIQSQMTVVEGKPVSSGDFKGFSITGIIIISVVYPYYYCFCYYY